MQWTAAADDFGRNCFCCQHSDLAAASALQDLQEGQHEEAAAAAGAAGQGAAGAAGEAAWDYPMDCCG
jgi:hypothetical protein